jgi:hypothetical protein
MRVVPPGLQIEQHRTLEGLEVVVRDDAIYRPMRIVGYVLLTIALVATVLTRVIVLGLIVGSLGGLIVVLSRARTGPRPGLPRPPPKVTASACTRTDVGSTGSSKPLVWSRSPRLNRRPNHQPLGNQRVPLRRYPARKPSILNPHPKLDITRIPPAGEVR